MKGQQAQQIPLITSDYIVNLLTMLEHLTEKVEYICAAIENISTPASPQTTPAPANFEVSLSFLASAMRNSKSTIERRIAGGKLPKPRVNQHNGYRYWIKADLPKSLYVQIDALYEPAAKASK